MAFWTWSLEVYSTTHSRSNFFNAPGICLAWSHRSASRNQHGQRFFQRKSSQDSQDPKQSTTPIKSPPYKLSQIIVCFSRSQPKILPGDPNPSTARWHGVGCRVVVERLPLAPAATAAGLPRAGAGQRHWAGRAGGKSPGCRGRRRGETPLEVRGVWKGIVPVLYRSRFNA